MWDYSRCPSRKGSRKPEARSQKEEKRLASGFWLLAPAILWRAIHGERLVAVQVVVARVVFLIRAGAEEKWRIFRGLPDLRVALGGHSDLRMHPCHEHDWVAPGIVQGRVVVHRDGKPAEK